jgi:CheY-like chemotaxis protein
MINEGYPVILLVEDDPGDQKLTRKALERIGIDKALAVVSTGEQALEYLENGENPEPELILLDLNMPGMGGKEFLRIIKSNESLCKIPVVVLTVSDAEQDIEECYKLQAAGYVQKAMRPEELKNIIEKVTDYWFETSALAKETSD